MKRLLARFMLRWNNRALMIARSAPVLNIRYLEQLRREEAWWDSMILVERNEMNGAVLQPKTYPRFKQQ